MLEIRDSVAVITGGCSGIGKTLAMYWIRHRGKVILADVDSQGLLKMENDISKLGGEVFTATCDVTKEEDNSRLAQLAIDRFGEINLIATCAGITKDGMMLDTDINTGKIIKKMSLDQFKSVLDVNLMGTFLTVRECAERMINLGCKGLICLISSIGSMGTAGQINYSSTKAAVAVMPKVITAEFFRRKIAHKIRCVAIAPGYVATPMTETMNPKALGKVLEQVPIGV